MKRIVICADGTWNEAEKKDKETGRPQPTNVLKVARAVAPRSKDGIEQVVYYHYGVGTAGLWDQITGGAFTVRTLAGFMKKVGLLEKEDEYFTPQLYGLYESGAPSGSDAWKDAFEHVRAPRPSPRIRFIGVWDTVGSLGAPGVLGHLLNRHKYRYHDIGLNDNILNAYHALAVDEQRKPFRPSVWTPPDGWSGALEQVWFPGVHSNVGGGYYPDGLANEALHWIVEKAEAHQLEFDHAFLAHYRPCFNAVLNDSMTLAYRTFGPITRPILEQKASKEAIHQAVLDRMQHGGEVEKDGSIIHSAYAPVNVTEYFREPGPIVSTTHRIARGEPCPPTPLNSPWA